MKQSEENGLEKTQLAEAGATGIDEARAFPTGAKEIYLPTKGKPNPRAKYDAQLLIIGAGIVLVLLLLALSGISHRTAPARASSNDKGHQQAKATINEPEPPSITPIMEAGRSLEQDTDSSLIDPDQIARTASQSIKHQARPRNLGSVPPFENTQPWQAPPYQPGSQASSSSNDGNISAEATAKTEHDSLDKSSLVFVRNNPASVAEAKSPGVIAGLEWNIGLAPGTRLRARLESAVSTAVQTPVVAVIEYNYEQNGEIIVPAGSKAFGHLEAADHSGYIGIRFDSLMLSDGSSLALEAAATDLQLRPLRGRVEGKHTGKNVIVRSFAGVGEIAATLVGRGSLNQPLSESDLMRERISNNIGQAGDQEVANLAITEHLVVSVPADTEIYVVLQKSANEKSQNRRAGMPAETANQASVEELRQLLRLQRELNEPANTNPAVQ
jgi:hypothetical protein